MRDAVYICKDARICGGGERKGRVYTYISCELCHAAAALDMGLLYGLLSEIRPVHFLARQRAGGIG